MDIFLFRFLHSQNKHYYEKIIVFASGSGTNAENIIKHFANTEIAKVVSVFTNNASAKVIERAKNHQIKLRSFKND